MRMILIACLASLAVACGAPPSAPARPIGTIEIADAWAAPTPEGVTVSAGYMSITNTQPTADTLISVESDRAGRAEVHEMVMEEGVMRMRRMESLSIEPDQSVQLAPGGAHLMFYDVATPFIEGETISVTLRFTQAGAITAELPVRPRSTAGHNGH